MERNYLKTTPIYVLSILGLMCCCFAGLGVIPAGIAFYMAHNSLKDVELNPENYDNIEGMNTAKTIAMIILIINGIFLLYCIYSIATTDWNVMTEQIQEIQRGIEAGQNEV
ncbi:CCC motif membrane protein [Formosa sp. L2A11]|uniref:CCC motif membrane protein n=1 Tax=Formosa sp. L2A11 TaxID=2686363 RepID=UPI00131EAB2C|nr:CCC motif membrane protein [Formosa sp. L2A11]